MVFDTESWDDEETTLNASNATAHVYDIEDYEHLDEDDPFHDRLFYKSLMPLIVIIGTLATPFPLTILIRRRMWLRHEGYFYLTTYLAANLLIVTVICLSKSLYVFNARWHIADTSEAACKIWSNVAQVVMSSDWLIVALLLNVYLRGHLRTPPGKFGCRNFSGKYCTLFGSMFVTALSYAASLLVNWWRLIAAHLFKYNRGDLSICHLSLMWYEELWLWRFLSLCVTQYVPVAMAIPVLCLMVVISNRRQETPSNQSDGDVIDDAADDAKQLTRLSLGIAAATFLLKSPYVLLEMIIQTRRLWFTHTVAVAWYATELFTSIQLVVVSALCIGMLRETRAILWSLRLDKFGNRRF